MRRTLLFCAAVSLCFVALDLRSEEQPLATRVDHFFVESDQAHSLFTFFKDTFQLPMSWPFSDRGAREDHPQGFASGGLWLGNVILEFVSFPHDRDKPVKTEFRGIAFEPAGGADETAAELLKRDIPRTEVENNMRQGSDGKMRVAWSTVGLKDLPPFETDVFFCDYKFRKAVAARRKAADDELAARNRGPLGIVGAAEIIVGVQDLEEARSKWSALLAPSPQISEDAFVFAAGPRIRLVRAQSPGIQGIILSVRSLNEAEKFLKERDLLARDKAGHISISPEAIGALSIRLIDDSQAGKSGNPFLGHGLGVDHVGIAVRDLEKTINDYEQALGFKSFKDSSFSDGTVRSFVFFENDSYLELVSVANVSDQTKGIADFAEKHEGAIYSGLATSSAKDAVAYLQAHNFEAVLSGEESPAKEGQPKPPPPPYYYVFISDKPSGEKQPFVLSNVLFFIEYVSSGKAGALAALREQGIMTHPNTAMRIHSVWFAVRDLDAGLRNLQEAGFEPGETRDVTFLGAKGREVKAGKGSLLLLQSVDQKGILNMSLQDHEDGFIIGLSIEVADLNRSRSWIGGHSGRKQEPYDGFYGRSILFPPELTHGVWLEFFQRN